MRRRVMALTLAAVMAAVMVAGSAAPAFAANTEDTENIAILIVDMG